MAGDSKTYEDCTNTKMPEDLRMTIIQNMRPGALRLHLELNSARLTTSEQTMADIRANLESRQPQAMEVDSYEQQEGHDVDPFWQNVKGKGRRKGEGVLQLRRTTPCARLSASTERKGQRMLHVRRKPLSQELLHGLEQWER